MTVLNVVAGFDEDFDDVHCIEITDVRDADVGLCGRSGGRCHGFRRFCRRCGCCCGRRGSGTAQGGDEVALFDFVADFDGNVRHGSGDVCRDFHGCLVGFEYEDGLAVLDTVARFDQDFDDIDCIKISNVGYANFIAHYQYPVS